MVITLIQGLTIMQQTTSVTASCITVMTIGIAAVTGLVYWLQQKKKDTVSIPTKWKSIGTLQHMFIYPLKSGNAVQVKTANCTTLGLMEVASETDSGRFLFRDRFFLVYQEESLKFMTARQKNSMLLITLTSDTENTVSLSSPNCKEKVTFKVSDTNNANGLHCSLHSNELVDVQDCGDEVAVWLSRVILDKENGLRLGFYSKDSKHRQLKSGPFKDFVRVYKNMTENDLGAYADIASYMILSQASVDDLNDKLQQEDKITARHFRPNIVVSGTEISAYDEDKWKWIKIGDVVLKGFKPCSRCLMVTLDPEKGKANPNKEPLATLKKYRQVTEPAEKELEGNSPIFGRYCGVYKKGTISVGDPVYLPA